MDNLTRLIECYVPIYACNLTCDYCYIKQNKGRDFKSKVEKFPYSPEIIAKALRKERLGGTCLINLCAGGETLLSTEVVDLARLLLEEGHYVMIVTNGTVKKTIDMLCDFPSELKSRLWMRFSLHYIELKNRNLLDNFYQNVVKVKNSGMSIAVEMVASDDYIPYLQEIKDISMKYIGSLPEISIARSEEDFSILTDLSYEDYVKTWSEFDSASFDFKLKTVGVKRKEFCYAGDWTATLDIGNGKISKCYSLPFQNIFEDLNEPIRFEAMGCKCPLPYCHNSHIWLTLGNIPKLDLPSFTEIRNKTCADGSEWLTPEMKEFVSHKFCETHKQYSPFKKAWVNFKTTMKDFFKSVWKPIRRLLGKIKRGLIG